MKFKSMLLIFIGFCVQQQDLFAQQSQFWLFWTHSQKLSEKINLLIDAQGRASVNLREVNTLLLRGALAYKLSEQSSIALGYAHKADFEGKKNSGYENRLYQQYAYNFKINKIEVEIRGRFEQRFLSDSVTNFALRARGFVSAQIPIISDKDFSSGLFAGLQNELFVNVLNKQYVNSHFFDQNRPYLSLGYRFNKKVETSIDYGLMSDQGKVQKSVISVFRLSLTTDF